MPRDRPVSRRGWTWCGAPREDAITAMVCWTPPRAVTGVDGSGITGPTPALDVHGSGRRRPLVEVVADIWGDAGVNLVLGQQVGDVAGDVSF